MIEHETEFYNKSLGALDIEWVQRIEWLCFSKIFSICIYLSQQDFSVPTFIKLKNRNKTMPNLYHIGNNNIHEWIYELTLETCPYSPH